MIFDDFTDLEQIFRNSKIADTSGNHKLGDITGNPFADNSAEFSVIKVCQFRRVKPVTEPHQLFHKFDAIRDHKINSTPCSNIHEYMVNRVFQLNISRDTPFHCHLVQHVDIKHLAGEGSLSARWNIDQSPGARNIGCLKNMPSRSIESVLHTIYKH